MQINSSYILVDNKKSLDLAVVNLLNSKTISIDTESSGYYTYYSKVCLIQISCNGKNFIIDPMAQIDVKALAPVFSSPNVLKLFHSASDDIKALKRDFHFTFKNIADTMYSSKLLGLEHNSLNYLVEFYHKVKLSKTEQKSNWEKRPLEKQQLQYAALDTAYLESIWTSMRSELERQGMLEEATSEFDKMAEEPYVAREQTDVSWFKFPEIDKYSSQQRRTIADILNFREEKARRMNKAPFRVINNETIIRIVNGDMDEERVAKLLGKKDAQEIIKLRMEPKGPPLEKDDIPRVDYDLKAEEENLFKQLRKWRDRIMKKRNIDHSMLPSNKHLITIIRANPKDLEGISSLGLMSEWKVKNYGPSILKVLTGENYDELIAGLTRVTRQKNPQNKKVEA